VIRVGFLQQNAFHKDDAYVALEKQKQMIKIIIYFYDNASKLIANNIPFSVLVESGIFAKLSRIKYDIPNDDPGKFNSYYEDIDSFIADKLNS
ncbi:MAG: V-type ATP synthase subunit A, partial [Oscillospiraceae bacterium]|nr:V-type ATP synthase subunit A [Oscillospiraceae bacterium]